VSLRSIGWDNIVIIEQPMERTIAEMDWRSAHTMLHEQAIYQQDGEQYQVEKLDLENRKAFVRKVAPDYWTDAMKYTRVEVMSEGDVEGRAQVAFGQGDVSVVEKVVGFKKIKFHTHENVGYGEISLPELQMHSTSFWLTVPEAIVASMRAPRVEVVEAIRALSTSLHSVACVGLMIDPRDLGRTLGSRSTPNGPPRKVPGEGAIIDPTIFLYDQIPGGVGLAGRLYDERDELLARARRLIEGCACEQGCPACIGVMPGSPTDAPHGRRELVLAVLTALGVPPVH
jgi:DEAD/DEAH box helicase domain-containing protein